MHPTTARDQLIAEHADIARRIALKMARRCPAWVPREDLVSAGMIGLIEAADRYDPSRKEPFLSFAQHRIRGAVMDELRRGDLLPRRVRQLARKITSAVHDLEISGEPATDHRIADALGVTVDHYREGLAQVAHASVESLDASAGKQPADQGVPPDEQASHHQMIARVRIALENLEPREETILALHYIEEKTYQEIASILAITPSRVCQLLWRGVEHLRTDLGVAPVPPVAPVAPMAPVAPLRVAA